MEFFYFFCYTTTVYKDFIPKYNFLYRKGTDFMSITADQHLHSHFSGDSTESMEAIIENAIGKGLTHICFTEHMDMGYPATVDTPEGTFLLNADSYVYDLLRMRSRYEDKIHILLGVELGLSLEYRKDLTVFARTHEYDFIIGSTHIVNGRDPYYPDFYEGRTDEEAYREYFQAELANLKSFDCYDVCGHLDYCVRYGRKKDRDYCYDKYKDIFDPMLSVLIEKGKGLEVNTGSLKRGMKDVSPMKEILIHYRKMGGDIVTIGSDAHTAEDVAFSFDYAAELLKDCGYSYYCIFENRLPEYRRL